MSIVKKGLKAVKKVVSGAWKFVKKNWKTIALVAIGVFTAGLVVGGWAAFSEVAAAQGFWHAVGSTMYAGVTAIGGTLGIGPGAQGAVAVAGNVQGAGLFSGHLAAALGSESAKAGIAQQAAAAAAAPGPGVSLTGLGEVATPALRAPTAAIGTKTATPIVGSGGGGTGLMEFGADVGAGEATKAGGGFFGGDLAKAALISTGGQVAANYFGAKATEEDDPLGFWGVDLTGQGRDVFFDPNQNQQAALAPAAPQAPAPMSPLQQYQQQQLDLLRRNGGGLMEDAYAAPGGYA